MFIFFNANAFILRPIHEEIFPSKKQGLMVVHHPAFWKQLYLTTYERNPKSTAYVPYGQEKYYAQGSFNGGHINAFINMFKECAKNVQLDEQNNITAVWHDESHLNKYIQDKAPLIMTPEYNYSEDCDNEHSYAIPQDEIKMILREKENHQYGGRKYLRGFTDEKKG